MYIKVRVTTEARTEKIVKKGDDLYVVSVCESPERGMANKRVLEILKKEYPGMSLKIVSGHHKPSKIVEVR